MVKVPKVIMKKEDKIITRIVMKTRSWKKPITKIVTKTRKVNKTLFRK